MKKSSLSMTTSDGEMDLVMNANLATLSDLRDAVCWMIRFSHTDALRRLENQTEPWLEVDTSLNQRVLTLHEIVGVINAAIGNDQSEDGQ